jgi:hypothetical protein
MRSEDPPEVGALRQVVSEITNIVLCKKEKTEDNVYLNYVWKY